MDTNEVHVAFEILLEEIEEVVDSINQEGSDAFRRGAYDEVSTLLESATRLTDFREKVKSLQREWNNTFARHAAHNQGGRRERGRLARGLRTGEDAFRKPILESLVETGGSAEMNRILDIVGKKMKDVLNEYDTQPLPSDPKTIRWRNTAQWCRNTLVREGLMKSDSPRGIWEISEKGRQILDSGQI